MSEEHSKKSVLFTKLKNIQFLVEKNPYFFQSGIQPKNVKHLAEEKFKILSIEDQRKEIINLIKPLLSENAKPQKNN